MTTQQQKPRLPPLTGLPDLDVYSDCPLPEDYEIVELLGDVIMVEYADLSEDGSSIKRGSIHLPESIIERRAWRVGKVLLTGPQVQQVKVGHYIIFPGDKGLPAIQRNGKKVVFLNEQRIFGICRQLVSMNAKS